MNYTNCLYAMHMMWLVQMVVKIKTRFVPKTMMLSALPETVPGVFFWGENKKFVSNFYFFSQSVFNFFQPSAVTLIIGKHCIWLPLNNNDLFIYFGVKFLAKADPVKNRKQASTTRKSLLGEDFSFFAVLLLYHNKSTVMPHSCCLFLMSDCITVYGSG